MLLSSLIVCSKDNYQGNNACCIPKRRKTLPDIVSDTTEPVTLCRLCIIGRGKYKYFIKKLLVLNFVLDVAYSD